MPLPGAVVAHSFVDCRLQTKTCLALLRGKYVFCTAKFWLLGLFFCSYTAVLVKSPPTCSQHAAQNGVVENQARGGAVTAATRIAGCARTCIQPAKRSTTTYQ